MNTFLNIKQTKASYKNADVVILPVSYEGTVSYGEGTAQGPAAIIKASRYIELYDEETQQELHKKVGIYTHPEVVQQQDMKPKELIDTVYGVATKILNDGKFICALGGEHTIALGIITAYVEQKQQLSVLHIDAHADLRRQYEGTPYSHACVMHHVSTMAKTTHVGIRSICAEEMALIKRKKLPVFFAKDIHVNEKWIPLVIETLHDDVYITLDVDGLDPSIIPSTGTPEPGGLSWYQLLALLKSVAAQRTVVGFDIVELAPRVQFPRSDFTCAKLCYKFLNYILS